jgi:hypothetical protein
MLEWDINPKVAAALIERRKALVSIVSDERAKSAGRARRVAISLEPGGPSRDVDLHEAPSARQTCSTALKRFVVAAKETHLMNDALADDTSGAAF